MPNHAAYRKSTHYRCLFTDHRGRVIKHHVISAANTDQAVAVARAFYQTKSPAEVPPRRITGFELWHFSEMVFAVAG